MARHLSIRAEYTDPRPTLIQRFASAVRSFRIPPRSIKDPELARVLNGWRESVADVVVTPDTMMSIPAIIAAIQIIGSLLASLPWLLYQTRDDGGRVRASTHRLYRLLKWQANEEMTSMKFLETLFAWAILFGDGYAEIERDGAGRPIALWPLPPWRVQRVRNQNGKLYYRVSNYEKGDVTLDPINILHLSGPTINGDCGLQLADIAREALGVAIASQRFAGKFFSSGMALSGVLQHPTEIGEDALENLRESINAGHQGLSKSHRLLLIEEGMTFKETSTDASKGQLLESRQYSVIEIARLLNISPTKLRDLSRSTYSNQEAENIAFVTETLRPWAVRLEQEMWSKLLYRSEQEAGYYVEVLFDGLLRGDQAARAAYYSVMVDKGIYSIDDVRRLENMPPIGAARGGDIHWVALNLAPSDKRPELDTPKPEPEPADTSDDNALRAEDYPALVRSGFSLNDIRHRDGMPPIDGPTGDARFLPRDLVPVDALLKPEATIVEPSQPDPVRVAIDIAGPTELQARREDAKREAEAAADAAYEAEVARARAAADEMERKQARTDAVLADVEAHKARQADIARREAVIAKLHARHTGTAAGTWATCPSCVAIMAAGEAKQRNEEAA